MTFTNWIKIVGIIAKITINQTSCPLNGWTANNPWSAGTKRIKAKSAVTKAKAAKLYQLFLNPILKILCCERQLNPWSKLA